MRGDKHAYGAAAVTPRTWSFLRHADVALAPVHAIQEGNADRRRDVRTVVVHLVRVPVVPETAETAKALVAARLTAENVGEVPQQLVHVHVAGLVAAAVLVHAHLTVLVVAGTLLIVLQHLIRLAHLDELLLRILVTLPITPRNPRPTLF